MLLYGIRALFLGLSVLISKTVYPLIPRLYNLFMYLANFQFFKEDFVKKVWNNLYVLVGVVVLFAIAIKLISGIVNPESLTDTKKGAKGAYLRAVIAVVLIFLTPIAFETLFDVQDHLLTDNYLVSHIFGYNFNNTTGGQTLAWETLNAFFLPVDDQGNEKTIKDLTDEEKKEAKYQAYFLSMVNMDYSDYALQLVYNEDMLKSFGVTAIGVVIGIPESTSPTTYGQTTEYTGFKYHSILCPLAGVLVAYEMILLCMDTIFRAAKLAILELMLPIVLGAYVFDAEILKKWAKEFFSTYIIVFFKVLALGLMVIMIHVLKGVIF